MPIKNLTPRLILGGAVALLAGNALATKHNKTPAPVKHIVHKGETLDKIAKWTGVSKKQIILANNLSSKKFRPGLALYIPVSNTPSPKHYNLNVRGFAPYTIRPHDSDRRIANMFHMSPADVRSTNPSLAWNHPKAGIVIQIPLRNAVAFKLDHVATLHSTFATITRPDTVVRKAPGSNAGRIAKVDAGRHVRILERDDHWYRVRFEYGTVGWVRGDLLASYSPPRELTHAVHHERSVRMASYHPMERRSSRDSRGLPLPPVSGDMLTYAQSMLNTPYSYGHASRSSTDCSGYTLQVLQHSGIKMPRTAAEQSHKGQHVDGGSLKPGDLVFFHGSRSGRISHVGIYVGEGKFIHASSGGGKVQVNSLGEKYYRQRFATARRVGNVKHHSNQAERIAEAKHEDADAMRKAEKDIKSTAKHTDSTGD